jgi:LPS sulfotransferase NodH
MRAQRQVAASKPARVMEEAEAEPLVLAPADLVLALADLGLARVLLAQVAPAQVVPARVVAVLAPVTEAQVAPEAPAAQVGMEARVVRVVQAATEGQVVPATAAQVDLAAVVQVDLAAQAADPGSTLFSESEIGTSYLICATPRTGSYLLCDLLTATGVAGKPTEYLLAGYRKYWSAQWGTSTYREYHENILSTGTTVNGVFGTKVHGAQLLEFLRQATGKARVRHEDRPAVIEAWFPHPRYIWSRRRDPVAQSVSWTKARQTNIWWDTDEPPAPPLGVPEPDSVRFDYESIERSMHALIEWDGVWRTYFDATGISPHTVWYEDLVSDYQGTIEGVLDALGAQRASGRKPVQPGFRQQADETSAKWVARFKRLEAAKRESTLAALAGLHTGDTVYVCTGRVATDRIPRDAVTISVDGAWSPAPASFALLTREHGSIPKADAALPVGKIAIEHPFTVPCLLDTGPAEAVAQRNRLAVASDASPKEMARALAVHLGAARIEMAEV